MSNRHPFRRLKHLLENEKGIALLLVLFVISLLIILSAEFAFTTRMEISSVGNYKEDLEGYYFAMAGFQYALTEVIGKYKYTYIGENGQVGFYRPWQQEETDVPKGKSDEPEDWPPIPNRKGIRIGQGAFDYVITDEEGRLNLNYLDKSGRGGKSNREIFRELLVATGVEDGEPADIIVDSVLDWLDRNDLHRLNGAETEWYEKNYAEQGFTEPYQCKNGKIDTIDELLMIRGITPEILYGSDSVYAMHSEDSPQYLGIAPYITVFGYNRRINKNTAPPLLLKILDPDNADEMLENRRHRGKRRLKPSHTFRIEVRGYKLNSKVSHSIMAVVRRSRRKKTGGGAEIIYLNDDTIDYGTNVRIFNEDIGEASLSGE